MVNVVIVGWYGTETIGDRAILAGLFNLFADVFDSFTIQLGSFYPVLTQRTLLEDLPFYRQVSHRKMNSISMFDSRQVRETDKAVEQADLVIVGGGPMAEIDQMYMLEYVFSRAKKKGKKTALLGCGVGPLVSSKIISSFYRLLKKADLRILRDDNLGQMGGRFCQESYILSCDPAVFAATFFTEKYAMQERTNTWVCVNFREIISGVQEGLDPESLRKQFLGLLNQVLKETDRGICLVPMHTFFVGGDDRYSLNWLANEIRSERIHVQNVPLSLEDTLVLYYHSLFCIGMRFHSILLQTLLNGKNYILDYTYPTTGKTVNFLKQFHLLDDYKARYVSLVNNDPCVFDFGADFTRTRVDGQLLKKYRSVYTENLNQLFS